MLEALVRSDVTTSGLGEQVSFSIGQEGPELGKAIDILVNGIYPNKIGAIVRELCSNAWDSHVAAGQQDRPFEVTLPSALDPVFRVRDYGVSLSHQDMMHLYTVFFRSSKAQAPGQNGKLGLGCKVPFCYTDNFTVTAWLRGEKRIYTAYRDESRVPRLVLMARDASDEEDGLEVTFACKAEDERTFRIALKRFAVGLDVLPKVEGDACEFAAVETVLEDKDAQLWRLVTNNTYLDGQAHARQGCVVYPIDADAIPSITSLQKAILGSPFFINFPLGDLEITASREALGYDEPTCRNILAVVDVIIADLQARYKEHVEGAATYWQACALYTDFLGSKLDAHVKQMLSEGTIKWRGRRVVKEIRIDDLLERLGKNLLSAGGASLMKVGTYSLTHRRGSDVKWDPNHSHMTVEPEKTVFVVEDPAWNLSMPGKRLRAWYRDKFTGAGVSHVAQSGQPNVVWIKCGLESMAFKRICAALGKPPAELFFRLDTMPRPASVLNRNTNKKPVMLRGLDRKGDFQQVTVNESDVIVYVELRKGDLVSDERFTVYNGSQLNDARTLLANCGYLAFDIIAVPATRRNLIKRNPHWVSFWSLLDSGVKANYNKDEIPRLLAYRNLDEDCDNAAEFMRRVATGKNKDPFPIEGAARRLMELVTFISARRAEWEKYGPGYELARTVLRNTDVKPLRITATTKLPALCRAFSAGYKMAKYCIDDPRADVDVVEYVNQLDNERVLASSMKQAAA